MIWYDFGPIRKSGSIVSTLTLHSLTGTLKGPGSFGTEIDNSENPKITDNLKMALADHIESIPENKNEVDDNEIKSAICGTTFENSNE